MLGGGERSWVQFLMNSHLVRLISVVDVVFRFHTNYRLS